MEILLVEDNPGDVMLMQMAFNEVGGAGITIISMTDGMMASIYIEQTTNSPDLIILDLNLPRKNGSEILQEINSNKKFHNVPVIIFTSSNNDVDMAQAYNMGAKAFVSKPVDLDEYQKQVVSFLKFIYPPNK